MLNKPIKILNVKTLKLHLTKNRVKIKTLKNFYTLLDILHFRLLGEFLKTFLQYFKMLV